MVQILLVEDERVTRRRIQKMLEDADYQVEAVGNGRDALARLGESDFDLVLLDIWMPDISGLDVLNQLRNDSSRPKVVVMTADDTSETALDAVRHEAYHYLPKPVEPEALLAVVKKAIQKTEPPPPIRVLSAKPHWVELAVPCERDAVERIQSFLTHLDADLDPATREAIGRVFREMLLNAVEWGGQLDPTREVRVTYLRAKKMILYRIADPGEGFRSEELGHAAVSNPEDNPMSHMEARMAKGIRPGGFGILMSQELADELLYNEAQNEVVFIKYLDS